VFGGEDLVQGLFNSGPCYLIALFPFSPTGEPSVGPLELDKALSMRSIAERLRDLGYSAPGKGLQEELAWYVKNRILEKRSDGYYKVRDKARVTVREAVA